MKKANNWPIASWTRFLVWQQIKYRTFCFVEYRNSNFRNVFNLFFNFRNVIIFERYNHSWNVVFLTCLAVGTP